MTMESEAFCTASVMRLDFRVEWLSSCTDNDGKDKKRTHEKYFIGMPQIVGPLSEPPVNRVRPEDGISILRSFGVTDLFGEEPREETGEVDRT